MKDFFRYAIYFAPNSEHALGEFGNAWLGHDPVHGYDISRPTIAGLAMKEIVKITSIPKRYGFHGTLKPPFELAWGYSKNNFIKAAAQLAANHAPCYLSRGFSLTTIGKFLALTPTDTSIELSDLAAACVQGLDQYRMPLTQNNLAARRQNGLTSRQDALLVRWGYPFVLDEFRFHLTLTNAIGKDQCDQLADLLRPILNPIITKPIAIDTIAVFGDPGQGRNFQLLKRIALTG